MPRRIPPEKAANVVRAVMTGSSLRDAAELAGVALSSAHRIKEQYCEQIGTRNLYDYAALVGEYLGENLRATMAQLQLLGDPEWLTSVNPTTLREVALAHGILNDKAIRLLAAWQSAEDDVRRRDASAADAGAGGPAQPDPAPP